MGSGPPDKKFLEDCLQCINSYRRRHQVPPLKINKDLNDLAQKWAEILLKEGKSIKHSNYEYQGKPVGENIYTKWTSPARTVAASEAVDSWYNEISNYNFETGEGKGTGHFTQLVWKSSAEVGIGRALSHDGQTCFIVTNYNPYGNIIGRYTENVLKPAGGHANTSSHNNANSATNKCTEKPKRNFFGRIFGSNNSNSHSPEVTCSPSRDTLLDSATQPQTRDSGFRILQHSAPSGQVYTESRMTPGGADGDGFGGEWKVTHREEVHRATGSPSSGRHVVCSYMTQTIESPGSASTRSYRTENVTGTNVITTSKQINIRP